MFRIVVVPYTSNVVAGLVVPMPTLPVKYALPEDSIVETSVVPRVVVPETLATLNTALLASRDVMVVEAIVLVASTVKMSRRCAPDRFSIYAMVAVAKVEVPVTVRSLVVSKAAVVEAIYACLKYLPAEPMS